MFDFSKINSFQVETSTYCNVACPLCPRHFMGTSVVRPTLRQRHILYPQWEKFLNDMDPFVHENHSPSLVFCGCHGDPAMTCLLYTSPSPRDATLSRMPSSA